MFLCVWSHTCTPYNKWNLLLSGEINASINGITIKWNRRQRKVHNYFNCKSWKWVKNYATVAVMSINQRAYYVKGHTTYLAFSMLLTNNIWKCMRQGGGRKAKVLHLRLTFGIWLSFTYTLCWGTGEGVGGWTLVKVILKQCFFSLLCIGLSDMDRGQK